MKSFQAEFADKYVKIRISGHMSDIVWLSEILSVQNSTKNKISLVTLITIQDVYVLFEVIYNVILDIKL